MPKFDHALDLDRIAAAPIIDAPYPHAIITDSILPEAASALAGALPNVTEHGGLRFHQIDRSPELDALIAELESDRFRALMERKFGIDLQGKEIFHTYRGMMRKEDGVIRGVAGKGRGIFGLYPATDPQTLTDFAEWRKKNGR